MSPSPVRISTRYRRDGWLQGYPRCVSWQKSGHFYNLPLDEMMQVTDNALDNGYTVAWSSDMSDRGFSMKEGVAIVPEKDWSEMTAEEAAKAFRAPVAGPFKLCGERGITRCARDPIRVNRQTISLPHELCS